jgi:nucleoside-diphosphate kinase
MVKEQCLVIIKPDGMAKDLIGDVISKISVTGFKIVGAKMTEVTKELAEKHYEHLKEKDFFNDLIKYIMGGYHIKNVMALVYEGEYATTKIREVVGATNPEKAEPTSVRGKYGRITTEGVFENVVHASENGSEAEREIKLWFKPSEMVSNIYPVKESTVEKTELVWE